MTNPYPISRESREEAIFRGNGGAVYGPFDLKIFDVLDVQVWTRADDAATWSEASPTVTKTAGAAFDTFSIAFPANMPSTVRIKVLSRRIHERTAGVVNGTRINPNALEKELSKQAATLQELRRDVDRGVTVQFGDGYVISDDLQDGDTLMKSGNRLVKGASAADITLAQGYAEAAGDASQAAIDAAAEVSGSLEEITAAIDAAESLVADAGNGRVNLLLNAEHRVITQLIPVRVGTPKMMTGYTGAPGSGMVRLLNASATPSGLDGLVPGKLIFVEGAGTPRAPLVNLGVTIDGGTPGVTPAYCNRITAPAGTFAGVQAGNTFRMTACSVAGVPLIDYQIFASNSDTYIEIFGGASGKLIGNMNPAISGEFYAGTVGIDPTVNGHPAGVVPFFEAQPCYSLQVIDCDAGGIHASLSGWYGSALNSSPCRVWEIEIGDNGYGAGRASDGLVKSGSLRWWRTYKIDPDGVTQTCKPGSLFGCKVQKGVNTVERMYWNLAQRHPGYVEQTEAAELAAIKGKELTFGYEWKAPAVNTARLFIYDGNTYRYSDYFTPGDFDYKEVKVAAGDTDNATVLQCGVEITGTAGQVHYGTQPMCIRGRTLGRGKFVPSRGWMPMAYHKHPLRFVGSPPITTEQRIRLDQETNGQLRGVKQISLDLEGRCRQESSMFLMDGPQTNSPGVVLLSHKENQQLIFSSGGSTIADGTTRYVGNGLVHTAPGGIACQPSFDGGLVTGLFVQRMVAGAGTVIATVVVDGTPTSITASMTGAESSKIVVAPFSLYAALAQGSKIDVAFAFTGGSPTSQVIAVVMTQKPNPPLHMPGMQPVGRQTVASPRPFLSDELYMRCNTDGWYDMTIDMICVEF